MLERIECGWRLDRAGAIEVMESTGEVVCDAGRETPCRWCGVRASGFKRGQGGAGGADRGA